MLHKTLSASLLVCILITNVEPNTSPEAEPDPIPVAKPDANPDSIADAKAEANRLPYNLRDYEAEDPESHSRHSPDEIDTEESRIVQDVYSPDYYEPNIILDYRYLKTGGRRYTRSDGGQILIIPKRNNLPIAYNNYDELLEYLRLKREADATKILRDSNRRNNNGYAQHLDTTPGLYEVIQGNVRGYEDTRWQEQIYKLH